MRGFVLGGGAAEGLPIGLEGGEALFCDHVLYVGQGIIEDKGPADFEQRVLQNVGDVLLDDFHYLRGVEHFAHGRRLE